MPSRFLVSLVVVALLSACVRENPGFLAATEGSGGSGGGTSTTTSSTTQALTTSGAMSATGSGGVGETSGGVLTATTTSESATGTTTTEPGTTGTSGAPGTSTGEASTGEAMSTGGSSGGSELCELPMWGEPPGLAVTKGQNPVMSCGSPKAITKGYAKFVGTTLQVHESGTCVESGPVWEFKGVGFDINMVPLTEACTAVRIEWVSAMPPCVPAAIGVTNGDTKVLVGAFGRLKGPTGYEAFTATPTFDCGCEVDGVACCDHTLEQTTYEPGLYTLSFPGGVDPVVSGLATIGSVDGKSYQFRNLRSRVREECPMVPPSVWFDMRWWAERM